MQVPAAGDLPVTPQRHSTGVKKPPALTPGAHTHGADETGKGRQAVFLVYKMNETQPHAREGRGPVHTASPPA